MNTIDQSKKYVSEKVEFHIAEINRLKELIRHEEGIVKSLLDSADTKSLEFRIRALLASGVTKKKITELLGISKVTLYRTIDNQWRLDNNQKVAKRMRERALKKKQGAITPPNPSS